MGKGHNDNYKDSKMRRDVIRSLQCFNDIIKELNIITDYINHSGVAEYDKEITYQKAFLYSRVYDIIFKYFPDRLEEVKSNDNYDE